MGGAVTRILAMLTTLLLVACGTGGPAGPTVPTSPAQPSKPAPPPVPPPAPSARVWAMVIRDSGACIAATVQAISGQAVGQIRAQTNECDAWAYDGGVVFENLTPGIQMTLRASAPGYASQNVIVVPTAGVQGAIFITLSQTSP